LRRARITPKHFVTKLGVCLAKDVALDVFVTENAVWVDVLQHANIVIETGIQGAECARSERVGFGPMGTPAVAEQNGFEPLKQLAKRNLEPVRSADESDKDVRMTTRCSHLNWTMPIQQVC